MSKFRTAYCKDEYLALALFDEDMKEWILDTLPEGAVCGISNLKVPFITWQNEGEEHPQILCYGDYIHGLNGVYHVIPPSIVERYFEFVKSPLPSTLPKSEPNDE